MKVLVIGASGLLGQHVADILEARGHEVRRGSRRPRPGWYTADVLDLHGMAKALDGIEAIVHCGADRQENARMVEVDGLRHLRAANPRARLVYPSVVGCDKVKTPYYEIKFDAEEALLRMGGNNAIVRLTQFYEFADRLARMTFPSVPVAMTAQPIAAIEAAAHVADAVESDVQGIVGNIGGPEIHRMIDLVRERLIVDGHPHRPILRVLQGTKGYKQGGNLCPESMLGRITWQEHLARAD